MRRARSSAAACQREAAGRGARARAAAQDAARAELGHDGAPQALAARHLELRVELVLARVARIERGSADRHGRIEGDALAPDLHEDLGLGAVGRPQAERPRERQRAEQQEHHQDAQRSPEHDARDAQERQVDRRVRREVFDRAGHCPPTSSDQPKLMGMFWRMYWSTQRLTSAMAEIGT